jgi:pilus assembly protein TadC
VEFLSDSLGNIPGGVGDLARVIISLAPWILFCIFASAPILAVRRARRTRVEQIEQDLPLFLELLATLAEAGLGFDTALARIQDSERSMRPLYLEFRHYQRDVLAGFSRVQALKHLVHRIEVNAVTVFVSALIQAEQIGAGLAETLRRQADDLRDRRKMQAVLQSQTLPVKLVFPLILCFLPGIFVSTLAPVIYQMIKVADSLLRNLR